MPRSLSRRQLGAGLAGLGLAAALPSRAQGCALPDWVPALRADLERMAKELTSVLKPWDGPKRVVTPEQHGYAGQKLATPYIQAAIDAAAKLGGGTVRLSKGDYVSGTLDLRSHIRLEVAKGARLLGSLDLKDYPERVAKRRTVQDTNMGMNQSLIFAEGCENIALAGKGTIDGRGNMTNFPGDETIHGTPGRPFVIRVIDCRRVHVRDLTLKDSPCWMQNYLNCDDLLVEHMTVENQANYNNDGIDIDGCRRVIVRHCRISAGDDALCFKGASQRPTQNVLIEDCRLYTSCNAIKLGTDSQSVFRNVLVRRCEVGGVSEEMRRVKPAGADSGISWEVVDGGLAENILATDIHIVRARSPLFMRLENRGRVQPNQPKPAVGSLRRVVFDRLTGADNGSRGSYFIGIPEKHIEDVVLHDIRIGMKASTDWLEENEIPEMRGVYPDAHMIDRDRGRLGTEPNGKPQGGDAPAYGLWTRHVTRVTLIKLTFVPATPDPRPQFLMQTDSVEVCRA
ncbi:glycoside hydrolase family 28 protein [Asticcacaulis sp. AND118]|uniref:glycoside hydrolase family 28 protein n=1 Tax=Asticcacaulis sp. AND118 TaxID=2840468 RepID=UPI001CFF582C|nr:glycosyl hydrolase family 28 protein [Asticcacaulis sp. AND118]UDF05592.1 right-handed parallel beta-helix repeat-containing protein [Asticcacaulis sp. AND118]